jgi:hypothetical protein
MKIDLKHAIFSIKDGAGTPKTLEINIGEGTLTFSEKRAIEYVKNRGLLGSTREGDQDPVDIRFDFIWEHLKSAAGDTVPTPYEALKKIGAASHVDQFRSGCLPALRSGHRTRLYRSVRY